MEYELINPSDPYTFIAEDFETAALAVLSLGTAYGARPKDDGENVPILIFGGAAEWYAERFGRTPDDGLADKRLHVADALASMMLGHFEDRRRYELALSSIDDPEKKARFIDEWQDGRSSLNDIGGVAHRAAECLKMLYEKQAKNKCVICVHNLDDTSMNCEYACVGVTKVLDGGATVAECDDYKERGGYVDETV